MTSLAKVFDLKNMRRAYLWLLSSTDVTYKNYFRDTYAAFAVSSDTLLKRLRQDCLNHRYNPSHASKVMIPKSSGTLRPITLLNMDDQIVYQALVNVISDALKPKTKHRYRKRVFAHLYGGRSSRFFYLRWQNSYRLWGKAITELHDQGFVYVADFDLASFYDSIDHHVLRHFLAEIGIDEDVIQLLMTCLEKWTSSTWSNGPQAIYHRHGIPQGPLSSGMLSEVVLQHIDAAGERGKRTKYLRYVDDIKILTKSEPELRRKLVSLDLATKEIGLFPQTSKINIRKIQNPADEIKLVSNPESDEDWKPSKKPDIEKKLLELTTRAVVNPSQSSRFRFLLSQATPNQRLSKRLLNVLRHHPELGAPISRYFSRYSSISVGIANELIRYMKEPEIYQSVSAELLRATLGLFKPVEAATLGIFCAERVLRPSRLLLPLQPTYKEALMAWAINTRKMSFSEFSNLIENERDWWVQKGLLREITPDLFGPSSYRDILNRAIRAKAGSVALCASARVAQEGVPLIRPYGDVNSVAKVVLRNGKIIRSVGAPASLMNSVISYVLKRPENNYDWKRFFAQGHKHAEQMALFLKQSRETDIDAFLTRFDSFADAVTAEIFRRYCPNLTYPDYGSAIKHPVLTQTFPTTCQAFAALHALRLESITAHPRSKKTGVGTRRLKHSDFNKVRPMLINTFNEIEATITP